MEKLDKFKKISSEKLEKIKKPIGEGRYAYVYPVNKNTVVKILKSPEKKNTEAEIHEILQEMLTLKNRSPIIPIIYQWDRKYIIMERLYTNLWNYTVETIAMTPQKRLNTYRSIILQVFLGIGMLQKIFPGFRHNDLKINNILIDVNSKGFTQRFNGVNYKISDMDPKIKISDFDYANIPGKITNSKVEDSFSKTFGCTSETSNIYDIHIFLNSLYKKKHLLPDSIIKWIKDTVTDDLLGDDNENIKHGRLIHPEKYIRKIKTVKTLLKDEMFKKFIVEIKGKIHYE